MEDSRQKKNTKVEVWSDDESFDFSGGLNNLELGVQKLALRNEQTTTVEGLAIEFDLQNYTPKTQNYKQLQNNLLQAIVALNLKKYASNPEKCSLSEENALIGLCFVSFPEPIELKEAIKPFKRIEGIMDVCDRKAYTTQKHRFINLIQKNCSHLAPEILEDLEKARHEAKEQVKAILKEEVNLLTKGGSGLTLKTRTQDYDIDEDPFQDFED